MKFMAAYLRGVRDYREAFGKSARDRKAIIEILKKYTEPLKDEVWAEMKPVGLNPNGALNVESLKGDLAWFQSKKYVEKSLPVEQLVDNSFAKDALKLIGPYKKK